MRKLLFSFCLTLFLCSCGGKEYEYADQLFDLYEEVISQYEDAESVEELDAARKEAYTSFGRIEEEQKESHDELIKDMEQYDEEAYLLHLDLLTAESHAQWLYNKRKHDLKQEEK